MDDFLGKLAETLEIDVIAPDTLLAELPEWDSLSVLSVIAMIDAQCGVNLLATELKEVQTAGGLYQLVQKRSGK